MGGIGSVFRTELAGLVSIVIDLPEDVPDAFQVQRTEVVFAVQVVVFDEAVKLGDLRPDANLGFRGKGCDASMQIPDREPGTDRRTG